MKDVGRREEPEQRSPLGELAADQAAAPLERPIRLRVELVTVEDDELRVDPPTPERLDVRPWNAGGVHGAVDDSQWSRHARSMSSSASWARRRALSASTIARIVWPIVAPG